MSGLKSFLFFNELSQREVAQFLGISKGQMSKLVSGTSRLKPSQLQKLLSNNFGWKTEFLTEQTWSELENTNNGEQKQDELSALRKEVELLREQLAKCEARNQEYWAVIRELTKNKQ